VAVIAPVRWTALASTALAAACGQVNQEPQREPDAADLPLGGPDAAVVADAGPRVARSRADFSMQQGHGGWRYLYKEPGRELKELTGDGAGAWCTDPVLHWTKIWADGMHPDVLGRPVDMSGQGVQIPVRRWVSDVAGRAEIAYAVAKADVSCGDGVVARILVDDVQLAEHTIAFDDATGVTATIATPVAIGSRIDFSVDARAAEPCDSTNFSAVITVR
jgi:hypothetical protein